MDLLPFQVGQLASILSLGPPINTCRDGAVWKSYVSHTNKEMEVLDVNLRAAGAMLPSFLSWPMDHDGLCALHRRLNGKPLESILAALQHEIEVKTQQIWQPVALAGGLSAQQTEQLSLMEELQGLWLAPKDFVAKFDRLPSSRYAYQTDCCAACILARMGTLETAMAIGALLLGSMRRSDMLSTRVRWCREWVRHTVIGDVDDVAAALIEMEKMGTEFRIARRWVRQRGEAATMEHQNLPYASPESVLGRRGVALTEHQQWTPSQTLPDRSWLHSGHSSLEPRHSNFDRFASPQSQQERWGEGSIFPNPSANSATSRMLPAQRNPYSHDSPSSVYSDCVSNPFLDGNHSTPSYIHNNTQLPPDLPLRLFDGQHSPGYKALSLTERALGWPGRSQQCTADRFKDGLSPPPTLAKLERGRGVGDLWRRRNDKTISKEE
jgi:hypothetical protein